jgi:hypothetical protein
MNNQETGQKEAKMETGLQKANTGNNVPMFHAGSIMIPSVEALGRLDDAETGTSLNLRYKKVEEWAEEAEKGLKTRAYYLGMKQLPNEDGEMLLCAVFADRTGSFLAAQTVIIDAVRNLEERTPVQITYNGSRKNKSTKGSTHLFDIKVLRINLPTGQEGGTNNG